MITPEVVRYHDGTSWLHVRRISTSPRYRGDSLGAVLLVSRAPLPMNITPRELDALTLAVCGLTNAQIAARLFISVRTAGHHLESASVKLGAPNRAACASYAVSLGLLSAQILRDFDLGNASRSDPDANDCTSSHGRWACRGNLTREPDSRGSEQGWGNAEHAATSDHRRCGAPGRGAQGHGVEGPQCPHPRPGQCRDPQAGQTGCATTRLRPQRHGAQPAHQQIDDHRCDHPGPDESDLPADHPGIEHVLQAQGYTVLIANTDSHDDVEISVFESLLQRRVDGFLLATGRLDDQSVVEEAATAAVPVVLVNRDAGLGDFPW